MTTTTGNHPVSTKTTITTICDSGHCQEVPAEVTRQFEVDGKAYELDLCGSCSVGLDTVLASMLKHARPVTKARVKRKLVGRTQEARDEAARVRAWWSGHRDEFDLEYQERGRIPGVVSDRYYARAA
jgi:hypothetical protein